MFSSRGNALFLILIAVALFAALSYAITQSGRGGGNTEREQAALDAAAISSYSGQLQQAYQRLRLVNGCAATQVSFEAAPYTDSNIFTEYPNSGAPSDKSCHFFHPSGGGLSRLSAAQLKVGDTDYTAEANLLGVSGQYFIFALGRVSYATCKAINGGLNYNAPTFEPPALPYAATGGHFTGSLATNGQVAGVSGALAGCALGNGSANYQYNIIGSGAGIYWYYFAIGKV